MKAKQCLVFLLGACSAYSAAQDAEFIPLGDLPGGVVYSTVGGVSADGSVVAGESSSYRSFWGEAVYWKYDTINGIGFLGGGDDISSVFGVSPSGNWLVGRSTSREGTQAFAWSESTGMFGLGDLPGAGFYSEARDVSIGGSVIVGNSKSSAAHPGFREAFRWTPDEDMVGLGFLGGEDDRRQSSAHAVSADGRVIVGSSTIDGSFQDRNPSRAFRWTEETGMVALDELPGGLVRGNATAVSGDGLWIVGNTGSVNYDGSNRNEAVLWHPDGTVEGLGILDRGEDTLGNSSANSISDDGRIITGVSVTEHGSDVFYWTRDDGMRPLEEYLLTEHSIDVDAMGWNLIDAIISGDGRTLVGTGLYQNNGEFHSEAWMVTNIPTPSTLTPLALLGMLAARRRRHYHPSCES